MESRHFEDKPILGTNGFAAGDLKKTEIIVNLFTVKYDDRDDSWKEKFFANINEASLAGGEPRIIEGPDGYPYFHLITPTSGKEYASFTINQLIKDFLYREGVGLAINPVKDYPDWVFSYGDIVNYEIMDEFYSNSVEWFNEEIIPMNNSQILSLKITEQLMPKELRTMLKRYLASFGITDPKISLVQKEISNESKKKLLFNITPNQFKNNEIFTDVINSISWFLPKQYTYESIDESSIKFEFL